MNLLDLPPSLSNLSPQEQQEVLDNAWKLQAAYEDFPAFCREFCQILATSDEGGKWQPFHLWPAQEAVARQLQEHRRLIILKARQLGLTWIVLAFALHQMLFRPIQTVLLFSKGDDEAMELLEYRLTGMYNRLPDWLKLGKATPTAHELTLPNGSRAMSFSTKGGRSLTGTMAIIDEADHILDLEAMLASVEPTVDAGGRLILLSSADKEKPESIFKNLYRAAKQQTGVSYTPIFLPWHARPDRSPEWYERKKANGLAATGSLDKVHQEYPATDVEALAPNSLDKRIPAAWLHQCYAECKPVTALGAPALPGLSVYEPPVPGRLYVIGADPAEGNPTSDDSAACVLDAETGEETAHLVGKIEMDPFASYVSQLAQWYNKAAVMCERNNHGHKVLGWWKHFADWLRVLPGHDKKDGWMSSTLGKTLLYDGCAEAFKNQEVLLHSFAFFTQLCSIEGNTLRAPEGQHDDKATAFALAVAGRAETIRIGRDHSYTNYLRAILGKDKDGHPIPKARPSEERLNELARRYGLRRPYD